MIKNAATALLDIIPQHHLLHHAHVYHPEHSYPRSRNSLPHSLSPCYQDVWLRLRRHWTGRVLIQRRWSFTWRGQHSREVIQRRRRFQWVVVILSKLKLICYWIRALLIGMNFPCLLWNWYPDTVGLTWKMLVNGPMLRPTKLNCYPTIWWKIIRNLLLGDHVWRRTNGKVAWTCLSLNFNKKPVTPCTKALLISKFMWVISWLILFVPTDNKHGKIMYYIAGAVLNMIGKLETRSMKKYTLALKKIKANFISTKTKARNDSLPMAKVESK